MRKSTPARMAAPPIVIGIRPAPLHPTVESNGTATRIVALSMTAAASLSVSTAIADAIVAKPYPWRIIASPSRIDRKTVGTAGMMANTTGGASTSPTDAVIDTVPGAMPFSTPPLSEVESATLNSLSQRDSEFTVSITGTGFGLPYRSVAVNTGLTDSPSVNVVFKPTCHSNLLTGPGPASALHATEPAAICARAF